MKAVDESDYRGPLSNHALRDIARISRVYIDEEKLSLLDRQLLSDAQIDAIEALAGTAYAHRWQLARALAAQSPQWVRKDGGAANKRYNSRLDHQLDYVLRIFAGESPEL